ncbi:MAG: hypothetical protein ACO3JL_00820 [Myxococcota bacterium]
MTHLLHADNEWRYDPVDDARSLVTRNRRILPPLEVKVPAAELRLRESSACVFCTGTAPHPHDRIERLPGLAVSVVASPTPLGFVEHEPPPEENFETRGALAAHELLVLEHATAHATLGEWPEAALALLLEAMCRRRQDLAGDRRLSHLVMTMGDGTRTRFSHGHATLLTVPFPSRHAGERSCAVCADLEDARICGRIIVEHEHGVAWVPFAPRSALHLRIGLKNHGLGPLDLGRAPATCRALATTLADVLRPLMRLAPQAALQLRMAPLPLVEGNGAARDHLLCELEVLFDVDDVLGAGLGVRVVTLAPEELALRLRAG